MKKIKKLGGLLLALVMLLTVCLAACEGGNKDKGAITGLYFVTEGLKTTYTVGEEFDENGVKLTAVYEQGSETLTLKSAGVTKSWSPELNKDEKGTYTLTATYMGKSASLAITYIEKVEKTLISISVTGQTAYVVGSTLNKASIEIIAYYSDGTQQAIGPDAEGVEISEPDLSKVGTPTLTVSYGGKTATLQLSVTAEPVEEQVAFLSLDPNSLPLTYTQQKEGNVDFTKAAFTVIYNTGRREKVQFGENGVTADPETVSLTEAKSVKVTFSYTKDEHTVECEITIDIVEPTDIVVDHFATPKSYADFGKQETGDREDRVSYLKDMGTYKVGNENAFVFAPDVRGLDLTNREVITLNAAKTTFTLFKKGADGQFTEDTSSLMTEEEVKAARTQNGVEEDTYTKLDSYYFFKAGVTGTFKLEITLSEEYRTEGTLAPITAEFEVVDGYNVYDQTGLSVLDNLNVKHWNDIKTKAGTLDWDLKPLAKYNSLADNKVTKQIVFHNNIEIDPDELPDYYFWDKTRKVKLGGDGELSDQGYSTAYGNLFMDPATKQKNYYTMLDGSLRDYVKQGEWHNFNSDEEGDQKEDYNALGINMQKAIYNNVGTSIEGNGMKLSYKVEGARHRLYSVHDTKFEAETSTGNSNVNPACHWSLIKYMDEGITAETYAKATFAKEVTISNITIQGRQPRLADSTGEPPQLMGVNTATDKVTFENCIVSRLYVVATGDESNNKSNIEVKDTKVFDVFSNMFYLWRSNINVTNSIMQEAGGPVIILCDGSRTSDASDEGGPHLYLDDDSVLESYAAGTEPWYTLNNANMLFGSVKDLANQALKPALGREILHKGEGDIELVNVMAIIICEPGDLVKSFPGGDSEDQKMRNISGGIYRGEGEEEKYEMNNTLEDTTANAFLNTPVSGIRATNAPLIQSGNLFAWTDLRSVTGLAPTFQQSGAELYGTWFSSQEPSDLLFLSLRQAVTTPRFGVLFGNVTKVAPSA